MNTTPLDGLAERRIWTVWRFERRHPADAREAKIPHDPNRRRRAATDRPETWGTFAQATAALAAGDFNGLALVVNPPLIVIDLDHSRDRATREVHPDALKIIRDHPTYGEVSQSEGGVKLLGCGTMPTPDGRGKNYRGPKATWAYGGCGGIEFYGWRRLFCWTGHHLDGTPDAIADVTEPLARLYRRLYPPQRAPLIDRTRDTSGVTDEHRVRRATAYVSRMPEAVSGCGGHDRTFSAACRLFEFGLSEADAAHVLAWFNENKTAPGDRWSDRELAHKLTDARRTVGAKFGYRLQEVRPPAPRRSHVPFAPLRIGGPP